MSQKAEYLKNVNFVSQKIAIFEIFNANFTVCDSFFEVLLLFHIPYLYIQGTLLCFTSMAKKIVSKVRGNFHQKNISFFYTQQKMTVYITTKKKNFSFSNYSRKIKEEFYAKKNLQKIDPIPLRIRKAVSHFLLLALFFLRHTVLHYFPHRWQKDHRWTCFTLTVRVTSTQQTHLFLFCLPLCQFQPSPFRILCLQMSNFCWKNFPLYSVWMM